MLAFAALAVVMLLWSGNMIVGRAVRDSIPPFTLALIRWQGASIVVLPFALPHLRADRQVLARAWRPVLLLGFTGVACFNAFVYSGLRYTSATNALLLQAAIPALVLIGDRLIFGARAPRWQKIGVAVSTLGVLVIVCRGAPQALLALRFGIGDLLVLAGVLAWSLYTSLLRLRPACHPLSFLSATFGIALIAMIPLAASEAGAIARIDWTPELIAACAYVAVLPSVVAYALYNAAVAELGAGRAGQTISLMPLFGALLAAALLSEPLYGFHLAGMALILAGIVVTALQGLGRR